MMRALYLNYIEMRNNEFSSFHCGVVRSLQVVKIYYFVLQES